MSNKKAANVPKNTAYSIPIINKPTEFKIATIKITKKVDF
jgi:hypothetical protein